MNFGIPPAHCMAKHFDAVHTNYLLVALMLYTDTASLALLQRMASQSTSVRRTTWRDTCWSQMT